LPTLRPSILLLTLAAFAPVPALAALSAGGAPPRPAAPEAGWRLAQDGDFDVFYDHYGRRILLDRETGEVVAVEPGEQPSRAERRRERRLRELNRDFGYDDDGFGDGGRVVRRLPAPPEDYEPYPGDDTFAARRPERLPRPDEPGGEYLTPDEPDFSDADRVARETPIERRPLDAASPQPGDDAPALEPGDTADAEAPLDGGLTASTPPDASVNVPASDAPLVQPEPPMPAGVREEVAALQVLLDRGGASPGVIDGRFGSNVDKALAAYNSINNANLKSTDAEGIKAALAASGGDPFTTYTISPEDAAGPFVASVPTDYGEKAKLERLGYASVTEMLAERFHMDETYLKRVNEGISFNRPGSVVRVANVGAPKTGEVVRVTADKAAKQVHGYGADGRLLVSYPATIGSPDTPSPSGIHAVARVAFDPEYTYNPKVNFQQGANDKVLRIPPGPNGPVGSIWIALDKPTYGVHGTPEPSRIGKAESHGCVRLTNWDAAELAKMVKPGVPVEFVE
jgi:lipoprotein-anchoring transpeptidase ErfK/SrfK